MLRRSIILVVLAVLWAPQPASASSQSLKIPNHVRFGKVAVGSQTEVFVTLTNTSEQQVTVSGIGVSGTGGFLFDFGADGCVGTILQPGDSCSYGIVFRPPAAGHLVGQSDVVFFPSHSPKKGAALIKLTGFGT